MARQRTRVTLTCQQCSSRFEVISSRANDAKYCSKVCHGEGLRRTPDFVCTSCGKQKTADDFFRDNQKKRGYVARCKDCYSQSSRQNRKSKPAYRLTEIKGSAKARSIAFGISLDEYQAHYWNRPCHYCGIVSTGIDRIDSNEPYTITNCVPCCGTCNRMKSDMSLAMFLNHIDLINKHLNR